jgi:hypothetical protein
MYSSTRSYPEQSMEVSGRLHSPATLPPRKEPQRRCGRFGEEIMISALFWGLTQRRVVIPYRRFGKSISSSFKAQDVHYFIGLLDP